MKNLNNINYLQIKNFLKKNNIKFSSDISDNEIFNSLKSIHSAGKEDLTFLVNKFSSKKISFINAKGCFINEENLKYLSRNTMPIIVEDPYKTFAAISNLFLKENESTGIISDKAIINKKVKISNNVQIDPFVNITEDTEIGENVIIESNCTIGPNVKISSNTIIKSNCIISSSFIGKKCIIKSGAVIGGTGFGFDPIEKIRIQHFGNVIIKDNCNIGSNTTIDRAVFDSTIINENCFIDNLVQVAHNVIIGSGTIIAAQSGIAGSAVIGKNVLIGGQVGISGHIKIGNNVKIAAKSGVTKNINDNSVIAGFPAIDIKKWKLMNIKLNKVL